jgi:hypothetical protein
MFAERPGLAGSGYGFVGVVGPAVSREVRGVVSGAVSGVVSCATRKA